MFAALHEAEQALEYGEIPIGAVVVNNNRIIGRGFNRQESFKDPTAHAEMIAISAAANTLKNKNLSGCDIYVSIEPCTMCAGAIVLSKINALYFGAFEPKTGACGSVFNYIEDSKNNHSVKVYSGIYATESEKLIKHFFTNKREIN